MRRQQRKFVLFDIVDFAAWLQEASVHRAIKLVQNHHTFLPAYAHFDRSGRHFDLLRGMENAHLERGFAEIAQNLTTFPDGTIAVCRSLDVIPAGIKGANTGGICIEHLGNFDTGGDTMRTAHRETIVKVNALLCSKFDLKPNEQTIVYHHWYDLTTGERTDGKGNTKTCPGTDFFGGNSVASALANFIPVVAQQVAALGGLAEPAAAPALYTAAVVADTLSVREAAGTAGRVVKKLMRGIQVSVFEEKDGWCRIDALQPRWVSMRYLQRAKAATTGG